MKITNAMYMISSTKLRKAKKNLEETEPYFYTLQSMIARIMRHLPDVENLLLAAWQTTCVGLDPFIHIPQLEKHGEGADGFGSFIPLPDRSSGPPPEEPVPRRC